MCGKELISRINSFCVIKVKYYILGNVITNIYLWIYNVFKGILKGQSLDFGIFRTPIYNIYKNRETY